MGDRGRESGVGCDEVGDISAGQIRNSFSRKFGLIDCEV